MLRDSRPENTPSSQDMGFSGIWRRADKRPPMLEYNRTSGQPRDGTSTNFLMRQGVLLPDGLFNRLL
jgi:hypothetical protein